MILATCASIVSLTFFTCMAWAVTGHFYGRVAPGMQLVSLVNSASLVWFAVDRWQVLSDRATLPAWREIASLAITSLALTLFWWAIRTTRQSRLTLAFSTDDPTFLVERGPYGFIRHPFYTSYIMFWIGAAVAAVSALFWVVPISVILLYTRAASNEENKFVRSTLSTEYRAYKGRTGMLLPRFRSLNPGVKF